MANWTALIRGVTIGDGTSYPITAPGISGLGIPTVRTADQPRGHLSGDVGGDDVLERRIISIPTGCKGTSESNAWTLLQALKVAWAPSYTDIPLVLAIASSTITYNGRPRGFEADLFALDQYWVGVLLTFEALNPFAAGEAIDVAV